MPNKKQISEFLRILANASITGVGYALGGKMGSEFMKGIFINLTSSVIESGAIKLKEQWLSNGALNHDIQQALTRATIKALEDIEKRYLAHLGNSISERDKESIKNFFKGLDEEAKNAFSVSLEEAVTEQDFKNYIYEEPEIVANKIWDRISHTKIFDTHHPGWFKEFFIKYFFSEMQFWFAEELKTDSKECNRAWRAFQRLLMEGIQADVKALQVSHDSIQKKLEDLKKLDDIRHQIELLKDKIDKRQPDEPFQSGLENAVKRMHEDLKGLGIIIIKVYERTERIENKLDELLSEKRIIPISQPQKIRPIIDRNKIFGRQQDLVRGVKG